MAFFYLSGERIMEGDRVLYAGEPSRVGEIGDSSEDPEHWIVHEHQAGVMIAELTPRVFGRILLSDTQHEEDLAFLSRADSDARHG